MSVRSAPHDRWADHGRSHAEPKPDLIPWVTRLHMVAVAVVAFTVTAVAFVGAWAIGDTSYALCRALHATWIAAGVTTIATAIIADTCDS